MSLIFVIKGKRSVPTITITLSKSKLDAKDVGYQAPLSQTEIDEFDGEKMMKDDGIY